MGEKIEMPYRATSALHKLYNQKSIGLYGGMRCILCVLEIRLCGASKSKAKECSVDMWKSCSATDFCRCAL